MLSLQVVQLIDLLMGLALQLTEVAGTKCIACVMLGSEDHIVSPRSCINMYT